MLFNKGYYLNNKLYDICNIDYKKEFNWIKNYKKEVEIKKDDGICVVL